MTLTFSHCFYVYFCYYVDAVMHLYTHDRLWPQLADLSAALGSRCNIVDSESGGWSFDEANSNPWARLADRFPGFPIPMACQSATVELRGELDVSMILLLLCADCVD